MISMDLPRRAERVQAENSRSAIEREILLIKSTLAIWNQLASSDLLIPSSMVCSPGGIRGCELYHSVWSEYRTGLKCQL